GGERRLDMRGGLDDRAGDLGAGAGGVPRLRRGGQARRATKENRGLPEPRCQKPRRDHESAQSRRLAKILLYKEFFVDLRGFVSSWSRYGRNTRRSMCHRTTVRGMVGRL